MAFARETIVGNVGRVYEKRQVGKENRSVIDFSIAMTPRKNVNGEWVDGDTYWMNCTAWGRLADNIESSFKPGDRVFVQGRMDMKAGYTNKDGVDVSPRPYLTVDAAGHEISIFPSEYKKNSGRGNNKYSSNSNASSGRRSTSQAQSIKEKDSNTNSSPNETMDDDFSIDFSIDSFDAPF